MEIPSLLGAGVRTGSRLSITPRSSARRRPFARLVAAGADLEARSTNQEFAPEATPLHSAVAAGRMDNAEVLLEAGANPNARQHGGFTPLMEAEQRGDLDLAELLIRHGAFAGGGA